MAGTAKTTEELIDETIELILSGGKRTTAAMIRQLMFDVYASLPNIKDGGAVFSAPVGYSTTVDLSDPKMFASVAYVLAAVGTAGISELTGDVTASGSGSVEAIVNWVNGYATYDARFLKKGGDEMDGPLLLFADGDQPLSPATLQQLTAAITALKGGVPVAGDNLSKLYNLIVDLGTYVGGFDASSGAIPTVGSGPSGAIDKGDSWKITVPGTITGVTPNAVLKAGDVIVASVSNPSSGADFFSIQSNVDQATSSVLGLVKLYGDLLASNTDGSVTQAALVTAFSDKLNISDKASQTDTFNASNNSIYVTPASLEYQQSLTNQILHYNYGA